MMVIAEQLATLEIAGGKGLQGMSLHRICNPVRELERLDQFGDQYRGRDNITRADGLTHMAEIEISPGREQGLQKLIAIIAPSGAVPRPEALAEQIKGRMAVGLGKDAIIQPQEADRLKGDGAHGQHGAEGELAAQESGAAFGLRGCGLQPGPHHLKGESMVMQGAKMGAQSGQDLP